MRTKIFLMISLLLLSTSLLAEEIKCPTTTKLESNQESKPYNNTGFSNYYDNAIKPETIQLGIDNSFIRSQLLVITTQDDLTLDDAIKRLDDANVLISAPGGSLTKCDYYTEDQSVLLVVLYQLNGRICRQSFNETTNSAEVNCEAQTAQLDE